MHNTLIKLLTALLLAAHATWLFAIDDIAEAADKLRAAEQADNVDATAELDNTVVKEALPAAEEQDIEFADLSSDVDRWLNAVNGR